MARLGRLEDHQDQKETMTNIRLATVFGDQGVAMHLQELLEFQAMTVPEKPFTPTPVPLSSTTFAEAAARFQRAIESGQK